MRRSSPLLRSLFIAALLALGLGAPVVAQQDAAAVRLLAEAERLERDGDVDAALREYRLLADRFPGQPAAAEALYSMARALYRQGNVIPAQQTAEELVAGRPRSPWSAAALVLQGRMLAERPGGPDDLDAARAILRRVPLLYGRDDYPRLAWRAEARVLGGEISLDLGEHGEAAAAFLGALEEEPPGAWTPRAHLGLATVLLAGGEWVAAAGELQRAVDAGELDPATARRAGQRLALLHRLKVRPAAGGAPWVAARSLAVPGVALRKPSGVAAAEDGGIAVSDRGADSVIVLDSDGALETRFELTEPGRPWWRDGELFVPSGNAVSLLRDRSSQSFVAPRGKKVEPVKDLTAGRRGRRGQWYLVDRQSRRVLAFVPAGRYLGTLAEGDPVDVAQDSQGRVYVLDRKAARVERFAVDGSSQGVMVNTAARRPEALEVDALGNLYVLDKDAGRIAVYQPDGQLLATLGPQLPGGVELRSPVDLAVDGAGRVIVADARAEALVVIE